MRRLARAFGTCSVWLACVGWLLPVHAIGASEPPPHREASEIADVRLDEQGSLNGVAIDTSGKRLAHQPIALHQAGRSVAETMTGQNGEFSFDSLHTGVYQIGIARSAVVCRVWAAQAAPPIARDRIAVVTGDPVVRGQRPIKCLFTDPLLIGAIVATAAIVIPLAVHNDGS